MELYQLRSFVAVAEMRHLTRAAEKLHISQPALSAQIRALEDTFSTPLFERTPGGMVLTAAGRRLLPMAEKVLSAAQAMRNEARAIKGEIGGIVRVGTVSDPDFIRVAAFMGATMSRYPLVEIEFHHVVTGEAFERVRDGELDASFYYGHLQHIDVHSVALREVAFRVVVPVNFKDRVTTGSFEEIAALPWVVPPPISALNHLINGLFKQHGVRPSRVVEADHEAVISSLAISGMGVALMREEKALERARSGEIMLWCDTRLLTKLQFIYAKEREEDPIVAALVSVIRGVWAPDSPLP
jgi:DNA-binding transcriptional LysR family regulator